MDTIKCFYGFSTLLVLLVAGITAQEKLRLCVQEEVSQSSCNALESGNSPLRCHRVVDSANCAIDLAEGRADFGVFTADELLLTHHFYPTGVFVVAELRNIGDVYDLFDFQSVVVVPKTYPAKEGHFGGLIGSGFCHPGFSKSQMWSDHILKYFEEKVLNNVCRDDITVAENELMNLRDFFKKGCRPGEWVPDANFDKTLKKKYPELCELCDNKYTCTYNNLGGYGHMGALDCLTGGQGRVAYAALHHVREYFSPNHAANKMSDYQFLCDNGTVMPLDSINPCTWFRQPLKVILARDTKAKDVLIRLDRASKINRQSDIWDGDLNAILFKTAIPTLYTNDTTPVHYLSRARDAELPKSTCGGNIRWCTISEVETNKCNWTSAAARSLGIKPFITCVPAQSVFECFDKISKNEADIITIDSNYGYLARKVYGLTSILYCDTMADRNSFVIAAIRDASFRRRITSLADIKNKNACFPEYGGIAWLSFLNVARDRGILPDSCKYPQIVAKLLEGACAPGFIDSSHFFNKRTPKLNEDNLGKLCELCPMQSNGERCEANSRNPFFGDKGALECLMKGNGDIAFLEARNLKSFINKGSINTSDYRVLCKNGSLANYAGFDVDPTCAFSVTIDSEVVSRRNRANPQVLDTTLALLKIEDWLGYRADSESRAIHVYDPFNGTENLLFKDSTNGLVPTDSDVEAVQAYKELFRHVDVCSEATTAIGVLTLVIINFFTARLI